MNASLELLISELSQPLSGINPSSLRSKLNAFIETVSSSHENITIELRQLRYIALFLKDSQDELLLRLLLHSLYLIMRSPANRQLLHQDTSLIDISLGKLKKLFPQHQLLHELLPLITLLCHEETLVHHFLGLGLIELLFSMWIHLDHDLLLIDALSLLQAVCCCREGRLRLHLHDKRILTRLQNLLSSDNPSVQARAVGTFHNISIEGSFIRDIREAGVIPRLAQLLTSPDRGTLRAAMGTVQNLSREHLSRLVILEQPDLVLHIIPLVFGSDLACQTAAAGALLNLLGPSLSTPELESLMTFLSDGIAIGAIRSSIFDFG